MRYVIEKKKQIMIERGKTRYVIEKMFWSKHRGGKSVLTKPLCCGSVGVLRYNLVLLTSLIL